MDTTTLFTWLNKGNAFANIRNGRSYAQVTAQKKLLPVPAACVRKTPDRNANAMKKVHNFPQRPKVSALKNGFSAQVRSTTPCVTVPACAGKKLTQAHHKSFTKYKPNVESLTLTNRFQALPVEEPNLEHSNVHTLDIKSPQNYTKATQLPQWNNISLDKAISHKNVLPAPPSMVISKPAKPEIAQIKVTKGDLTLGMINAADDISADNMLHGQFDSHMASGQTKNVPEDVWQNRLYSKDYKACVYQNGDNFGYIPLNDLHVYKGPEIQWKSLPDIWQANKLIRETKVPNFLNCRIPVKTQLNPDKWRSYLTHYWDQQLPDLIQYGFPLDFNRDSNLVSTHVNHTSAIEHEKHIDQYIAEELKYGALYGPFEDTPIPVHVSPLMTRAKQNSDKRRTIVDLSWPKNASVNAAVQKNVYLGSHFVLKYPSLDDITTELRKLGPGALIYKVDISRAFRHIRIDPGDIDLLGIRHKSLFLDGSLPFGFRLGSGIFERCSDAIRYIMKNFGHNALMNYIDDLIYIGLPSKIYNSYSQLLSLLKELGLEISQSKLVPPSTSVVCLGIQVNTVARTLSIPDEKLAEIRQLCEQWVHKKNCTKNQLQSLLGSLLYITRCVRPARNFLNRMLQILRDNVHTNFITLSHHFFQDLEWFRVFLHQFNGVTFYDNKLIHHEVNLDASLNGLGACFGNEVYALPLPVNFMNLHITQLEMLNVVVALKVWANIWANKRIKISCDNLAVVEILKSGKTRDPFLATCAKNIWLITAMFNIDIILIHVPGVNNQVADLLSRWTITSNPQSKLMQILPQFQWIDTHIDLTKLNYFI